MLVTKTENRPWMKIFSAYEKSGCFYFYDLFMAFSVRRQKKGAGKFQFYDKYQHLLFANGYLYDEKDRNVPQKFIFLFKKFSKIKKNH